YSSTTNVSSCTAWTTCAAGKYVSTAGSSTTDRACTSCGANTFSSTTNASSCSPWKICTWATSGTVTPGSSTADAVCGATATFYRQFGTSAFYEYFATLAR